MRLRPALPLLLAAACGGEPQPEAAPRPPAVLITLDTTVPGALDPYRTEPGVTPNLAALAAEGVVFDAARTVAPLTLPSHASMHTGLYPIRHTVRDNGHTALPESARTVAEAASAAGYRTGAFVAAGVMARAFGLGQGFETYDAPAAENEKGGFPTRWAGVVTESALEWIEEREEGEPYFLWVHYFDPHLPYDPPPRFARRFPGQPYLAEVAKTDHHVGRVLERLREEPDHEQTLIVVVADHGEAFGINGEATHGTLLHDATLRVPLVVRFPGGAGAGTRRDDLVSVVDVAPTLVAHMGLEALPGIDGLDLAGPVDRPGVYAETYIGYLSYGWAPLVGWAGPEGLYVHGPRPSVSPPRGDGTLTPAGDQAWLEGARARIDALDRAPKLEVGEEAQVHVDLSSLGYAAGFDLEIPPPLEVPEGLPDPIDRLPEAERGFQALIAADVGKLDEGIALLEGVTRANPRNAFAFDQLANLYLRAKRPADAVATLHAILDTGAERPSLRRRLALAHLALGETEPARAELQRLLEMVPDDAEARELLDGLDE